MPNKDTKIQVADAKAAASPVQGAAKAAGVTAKGTTAKTATKEAMSPTSIVPLPATETDRIELLGSLTTQQQQRTSARVIKKLRLEPIADKEIKREVPDCETPNKVDEKDPLKFPTVKQRMPKALWSTDEKNHFFEALNEYGKDFDAITAYICAKMKKKGMTDPNLKTKTQVSHFYYRTWHKLSKHVHFDENVKKVAQELYALINYGELRKKLVSVSEKTCAKLGELVVRGSIVVRTRGRNVRVRTPMCRALRKLNQITERACGARVCSRATVVLRARDAAAWARVQAAAHNPRAAAALQHSTRLAAFLAALARRWGRNRNSKREKIVENAVQGDSNRGNEEGPERRDNTGDDGKEDLESHLKLPADRIIVQEQKQPKKLALYVAPRPNAQIHIPVISPSEQLSSQKICFSSYLQRMCLQRRAKDDSAKIRTTKRQRKDSATEPKDPDPKKLKLEVVDPVKTLSIEETAIDGIELMATYRHNQDDEEKPSTEDEKDKPEEVVEEEVDVDKDVAEKEKEKEKGAPEKDVQDKDKDTVEKEKDVMSEREKDSFSELEDDEKFNKSESDNESDHGKDKGKERKFKNLKVKFRIRPKKRGGMYAEVVETRDEVKVEPVKESAEEAKPDIDLDLAIRQVRRGWSVFDAGDLTIGDLYLMFGSRSKLELDYWWAEPTPPLPHKTSDSLAPTGVDKDKKEKADKTPDKDNALEDKDKESDTDIFSPKTAFNQDSNDDGMSGDERKCEQLASPDHKSASGTFKIVNKLINRPTPPQTALESGLSLLSDRLKRLLALVGNTHVSAGNIARCACGHVCPQQRRQQKQGCAPQCTSHIPPKPDENSAVFRHPTPIAPRPDFEANKPRVIEGLPRWRRGRPRLPADRRVVVQRLLPLLPKLPPPSNLIPVKMVPNSPPPLPRILPKPPPTSTSDLSFFYVLSESNGQFFFHDGDRKIPITPLPSRNEFKEEAKDDESNSENMKMDLIGCESLPKMALQDNGTNIEKRPEPDIASFLPSESMSLSPSRLLRDSDGWPEGSVQDFSLSSFLGHLDGRPEPDLAVDSQLQSLMVESSVDYMAKFADLAAEVIDDQHTDLT